MTMEIFGWGALVVGLLIVLTKALRWPQWLHYLWGGIVLIWGILGLL